jgi:GNAT superfamily N-acetyltransferase
MNIDISYYKDEYLDQVNIILKEAFNIEKSNFNGDEFKEIVSIVDGEVCGYLLLTKVLNPIKNKYYYLVDYVCVLSKYRGLGISDKLMEFAEEIAREDNAMYLQLTCSTNRVAAHKLYERCGYIKRDSDQFRKVLE